MAAPQPKADSGTPKENTAYISKATKTKDRSSGFSLVDRFPLGYRNREDITNLPPGVLVVGSQNVLTNVSERIQIRKGYALDGEESAVIAPILGSFDWLTRGNGERHMRAGFLTTAGNDGKLQYRYEDSSGTVTWRDLMSSLTSVSYNFCTFWDTTELLRLCLFVNGASEINEWNGAITTFSSATVDTITKEGTTTWAQDGFYTGRDKKVILGGIEYTYTGGESSTTLTGVTPAPNAGGHVAGDVIHQKPVTTANSSMTDIPTTFKNNLIENLYNQIYVGSLTDSSFYLSKVNDYQDFSFTSPTRAPGEGAEATLDANLVAFIPQEENMYISCGKDMLFKTGFTKSGDLTKESFDVTRLKTTAGQGVQSQALLSKIKNDVVLLTNEPTMDTLGRIENILGTPQTDNISDSIKLDFDQYDFTDGSTFYHRYYIYVAIPKDGVVCVYNLTTGAWEAPQTLPISRFYVVNGELYGHSYGTSESYKLFTGYSDRATATSSGLPIQAVAKFSYQNFGTRSDLKNSNEFYIEGYINNNTTLQGSITYEIDGCATSQTFEVSGSDGQIVCLGPASNSLGKFPLGKQPLGGATPTSLTGLPPKFRVIKTYNRVDFYECQFSFSILGADQRFELLAFGLNAQLSTTTNSAIKQ